MVVNITRVNDEDVDVKQKIQEIIVENACTEYNTNVKQTLNSINKHLDEIFEESYTNLGELEEKIAARTNFLEKNPTFLNSLTYTTQNIKISSLREFDEIKITLKEHSRRITEKVEEIQGYHRKLFDLVLQNSKESLDMLKQAEEFDEELFEDCLDKDYRLREKLMRIPEEDNLDNELPVEEPEDVKPSEEETPSKIEEEEITKNPQVEIENPPNSAESINLPPPTEEIPTPPLLEDIKKPEPEPEILQEDARPISSVDNVTIKKNAFSEITLGTNNQDSVPDKFQIFPNVTPDVQRRKPSVDLHGRLMQQLEASDSLEGFIKLMERKPTGKQSKEKRSTEGLQDKFNGSLWFFSERGVKGKVSKNTLSTTQSQKNAKLSKSTKHNLHTGAACCNLLVTSSQGLSLTNQEKTKRTVSSLGRNKLKCYDLLDDINDKDLKPIKSEYPRKDNVYIDPCGNQRKLNDDKTYLHLMMEGNEKVWRKLLQTNQPSHEQKKKARKRKSARNLMQQSEHKIRRNAKNSERSPEKEKKPKHGKNIKSLIEYLTSPEQKYLNSRPQSLVVMPVRVIYDNFPAEEFARNNLNYDGLIEYLTSPQHRTPEPFTVMPVKVIYDNHSMQETFKPENPSGKISSAKPPSIVMATNDTPSLALHHANGTTKRIEMYQKSKRNPLTQVLPIVSPLPIYKKEIDDTTPCRAQTARNNENSNKNKFISLTKTELKTNSPQSGKEKSPHLIDLTKLQEDHSSVKEIKSIISPQNKSSRDKSQQRIEFKIEENNQKAITEVKQAIFPIPRYPKNLNENHQKLETKANLPEPIRKKKEILDQLKSFKVQNNDALQQNIQRTIDVIELKLIDLLSSPTDSNYLQAFGAMEEEITNVLKLISDYNNAPTGKTLEANVKNVERTAAERDENHNKSPLQSPTLKRSSNTLKNTEPMVELTPPPVEKPPETQVVEEKKKKEEIKPKKVDKIKTHEEKRRAANIEEGERLLGQVDNVIKKIDNIYTKFCDESKIKEIVEMTKRDKNTLSSVVNFFTDINTFTKETPMAIEYLSYENISEKFETPRIYGQARIYYKIQKEDSVKKYEGKKRTKEKAKSKVKPPANEEKNKEQMSRKQEKNEEKIQVKTEGEMKGKIVKNVIKSEKKEEAVEKAVVTKYEDIDQRHQSTLTAFYTLFFSGVFLVLNFDYTA